MEPLYSGHPWGIGRYIEVAFIEGVVLYTSCSFGTWVPGCYTEVAVKRGSTVYHCICVLKIYYQGPCKFIQSLVCVCVCIIADLQ